MKKPSVKTKCVANSYSAPNERIIEFDGGLIAFRNLPNDVLLVSLYRLDNRVQVSVAVERLNGATMEAAWRLPYVRIAEKLS